MIGGTRMNKQDIEKAIETLKCIKNRYSGYPVENALILAISALEQQLNGGWVSVGERLPEIPTEKLNEGFTGRQVLVFTNTEPRKRIAWFDIENNKFYDDYSMFGTVTEVTHWQYLSDDPKEVLDAERN
jgi:hypothetical protein